MRILIILLALWFIQPCFADEIIVNINSELSKRIALDDIRDIFFLKKGYYPNGVRVQVFLFNKESIATRNFLTEVLKISPSAYFDMLDTQVAMGRSNLPIIVDSDTRMVISIAVHRGGIGIIRDAGYVNNLATIKIIEIKEDK